MSELPPWEPPFAGNEIEHLLGALDRQRATFRWKAGGLGDAELNATFGASALTIGGLLKHLACVEDEKFGPNLDDARYGPAWAGMAAYGGDPKDYTFDTAGWAPEALYELWDDSIARSRSRVAAALERGGLDQRVHLGADQNLVVSLRRLLFDLLEEYGRHTGHADLIRESIDGRVGEDPSSDWRP